jgi:hypothetical protein
MPRASANSVKKLRYLKCVATRESHEQVLSSARLCLTRNSPYLHCRIVNSIRFCIPYQLYINASAVRAREFCRRLVDGHPAILTGIVQQPVFTTARCSPPSSQTSLCHWWLFGLGDEKQLRIAFAVKFTNGAALIPTPNSCYTRFRRKRSELSVSASAGTVIGYWRILSNP